MVNYKAVDPRKSPRFSGIKTFMRLPHVKTTEGIDFAVIGVPCDEGASFRTGQRSGPEAIRSISALLRPHNPVLDVSIFNYCSGVYRGESFSSNRYWILLGGDHSLTLPESRAVVKKQINYFHNSNKSQLISFRELIWEISVVI